MKEVRDWVDVGFKIILALVGIVVGYYFSFQKQQNDDVKMVIELASSAQAPKRLMGASVAQAYFDQKRIPQTVFVTVFKYANNSDDPHLRAAVNTAVASSAKSDQSLQEAVAKATVSLPLRIYFHIRQEQDRGRAAEIQKTIASMTMLDGNHIIIPGIELIAGQQKESLLFCFKKAECEAFGAQLKKLFIDNGVAIELKDQSRIYENSQAIRPNHFEAWFAPSIPKSG